MLITKLAMEKVGRRNFGKFMVIRQIRQCFPSPKFPSIQYIQAMLGLCGKKASFFYFYMCLNLYLGVFPKIPSRSSYALHIGYATYTHIRSCVTIPVNYCTSYLHGLAIPV